MLRFRSEKTGACSLNLPQQWQLDQTQAVSPQLRRILRSRIIRNDLKPSSSVSETGLAKAYKVSRQPVREALITLVNEGLVEIRPQRGTFVKRIDLQSVLNGRFVREAVEADIVRMIARNPDKTLVSNLRKQLTEQRRCRINSASDFIELDEKFHRTLADAAGLNKVWDFLEATKAQMDRVRFITFGDFPTQTLIEQHQLIVDCIDNASPESAQTAMKNHLREILGILPKVLEKCPEYFDYVEALGEAYTPE